MEVCCDNNSLSSYKNLNFVNFKYLMINDGYSYVVKININLKFENNVNFECMLNDIKSI
jgi:hypothetical protein